MTFMPPSVSPIDDGASPTPKARTESWQTRGRYLFARAFRDYSPRWRAVDTQGRRAQPLGPQLRPQPLASAWPPANEVHVLTLTSFDLETYGIHSAQFDAFLANYQPLSVIKDRERLEQRVDEFMKTMTN
jgi:hypothetical protein